MERTVSLFRNGRNQAVRIPREFELPGTEAVMRRDGDRLIIEPVARPTLVGLKQVDPAARLRAGAHLLARGAAAVAANDQGFVTSAAFSPTLGHSVALALLAHGPERHGERVVVHDPLRGGDLEAEVCSPVFVDPEGVRVRG